MCGPFLLSYAASWTRPRPPLPVRGTCRDQLDAPASVPSGALVHVGISGRARVRPFPVRGHMSGSAGRVPRLSLLVRGTSRASPSATAAGVGVR